MQHDSFGRHPNRLRHRDRRSGHDRAFAGNRLMPTPGQIFLFTASLTAAWAILGAVVVGFIEFMAV